jgi:hypothetical protein
VSFGSETAKPEKFVAYRAGGLKGRLQARLPATRKAKAERRVSAFQPAPANGVNAAAGGLKSAAG